MTPLLPCPVLIVPGLAALRLLTAVQMKCRYENQLKLPGPMRYPDINAHLSVEHQKHLMNLEFRDDLCNVTLNHFDVVSYNA